MKRQVRIRPATDKEDLSHESGKERPGLGGDLRQKQEDGRRGAKRADRRFKRKARCRKA